MKKPHPTGVSHEDAHLTQQLFLEELAMVWEDEETIERLEEFSGLEKVCGYVFASLENVFRERNPLDELTEISLENVRAAKVFIETLKYTATTRCTYPYEYHAFRITADIGITLKCLNCGDRLHHGATLHMSEEFQGYTKESMKTPAYTEAAEFHTPYVRSPFVIEKL